jgi:hypothetical protein
MKKLIITSILTVSSIAHAVPMRGFDYLGMQHPRWNCDASIEALPQGAALGTLHGSFGDRLDCIEKAYASTKVKLHRVHLENGTCVNNNVCAKSENLHGYNLRSLEKAATNKSPKLLDPMIATCSAYKRLADRYGVELLCSPLLEHQLSPRAFAAIAEEIKKNVSGITIVNSPRTPRIRVSKDYLLEQHGDNVKAPIVSLDGKTFEYSDFTGLLKKNADSKIVFVWSQTFNGREEGPFVPIAKRTNFPTPAKFREAAEAFTARLPIKSVDVSGCGAGRFDGRKDETGGLVLLSKNTNGYKVVTPKKCGQFKHVTLIAKDGKKVRARFSGLANGDRAHYNAPRGYNKMPTAFILNRVRIELPTRCAKLDRCE